MVRSSDNHTASSMAEPRILLAGLDMIESPDRTGQLLVADAPAARVGWP